MKPSVIVAALAAVAFSASALPAMAQDAAPEADWDVMRDPAKKSVIAYIPVTTGLMLAVRCVDGALDGVILGLPRYPADHLTRPLGLAFGDEPMRQTRWSVTTDRTVAISDYPAAFARSLKRGGPLRILIPGGADDGRNLRHDLILPPSSAAIEETLTACNRSLEDPRDALLPDIEESGLPTGFTWATPPRPRVLMTSTTGGYVVATCVAQTDGSLNNCQIESEQPPRARLGEAVLRAVRDARIDTSNQTEGQSSPRIVAFRVSFYRDGYQPRRGQD